MLAGLLVVLFVEAADQFLEDRAHAVVVQTGQANVPVLVEDRVGAEVDVFVGELLDEAAENVGLHERRDLIAELEFIQDLLDVRREAVKIGLKVGSELLLLRTGAEVA